MNLVGNLLISKNHRQIQFIPFNERIDLNLYNHTLGALPLLSTLIFTFLAVLLTDSTLHSIDPWLPAEDPNDDNDKVAPSTYPWPSQPVDSSDQEMQTIKTITLRKTIGKSKTMRKKEEEIGRLAPPLFIEMEGQESHDLNH